VRASAIVLAHGSESTLVACVRSLVEAGVGEILVVDNDAAPEPVAAVGRLAGVRVLSPGCNLGYAGGCNYAAEHASGDVLVFVNSDALVRSGAVDVLVRRALEPDVGLVSARVLLAQDPGLVNAAGNPVHFLMFSWAGGLGEPADPAAVVGETASISGVAFAVRRGVWDELGGFDEDYFAYCEDVYLSMRAWQAGYRVLTEPAAVVLHHYEFGRNLAKHYLLERNRLMNLLLLPESRTRRLVGPAAVAVEIGVLAVALRDGWAADKVAGWRWLLRHRRELAVRRRTIQAARRVPDRDLAPLLRGRLDPPEGLGPAVPPVVSAFLERYWSGVQRWV
jgi:GT2 family glycosyltransferase